jgi:Protein of unknown function (DUF3352)
MRTKIIAGLTVTGIAGIIAAVIVLTSSPYTLASMAPAHTVAFAEAQDLESTWAAFKETQGYEDMLESRIYEELEEEWEDLREEVEDEEYAFFEKTGIELNEAFALDVVGQNIAIGLSIPEQGKPAFYLMTKIDTTGLIAEAAVKGDWRALWDALDGDLEDHEFETEDFKGFKIASRVDDEDDPFDQVHVALVEDVLVVSHSKEAVKDVISVHAGEATSLADTDKFDQEYDSLYDQDESPSAYAWVDLTFIKDTDRVEQVLHDWGEDIGGSMGRDFQEFKGELLSVLRDDLHADAQGVALGLVLPEGDLYELSWTGSREPAELFADYAEHDLRGLVNDDTVVFVETKDVLATWRGFMASEAWAKLQQAEAFQWLKDSGPKQLGQAMRFGGRRGREANMTFEVRLMLLYVQTLMVESYGNDFAAAIQLREEDQLLACFGGQAFVKARPALRIVLDVLSGVTVAYADEQDMFDSHSHGGQEIWSLVVPQRELPRELRDQLGAVSLDWTRVGAYWVLSVNDPGDLHDIVDRANGEGTDGLAEKETFQTVMNELPEDYTVFAYYDLELMQARSDHLSNLVEQSLPRRDREQVEMLSRGMEGVMKRLQSLFGSTAAGVYVSEEFDAITVRSHNRFSSAAGDLRSFVFPDISGEPDVWTFMPEETFGSVAMQTDLQGFGTFVLSEVRSAFGDEGPLATAEERLGLRLQQDLLDHVGDGLGMAVIPQEQMLPPDEEFQRRAERTPAVPGFLGYLKLSDADAFRRSFTSGLERVWSEANFDALIEKQIGGQTVWAMEPDHGMKREFGLGVSPCFAVVDGYLVLSSSEPAMRRAIAARQEGSNLASSEAFATIIEGHPRDVPYFMHFDWDGLAAQAAGNAHLLADALSEPPKHLKAPAEPVYPDGVEDWEEMERIYNERWEKFNEERQVYDRALEEWQASERETNLAKARSLLLSLGALGDFTYHVKATEGEVAESVGVYRLDLDGLEVPEE